MRFVLAIAIITGVFATTRYLLGATWALGVSVLLLLIFWGISNYRESTLGLLRANIKTYFMARLKGYDHIMAMRRMIESRYWLPFDRATRESLLAQMDKLEEGNDEGQLKYIVLQVFFHENGVPPLNLGVKLYNDFDKVYEVMKQKYMG